MSNDRDPNYKNPGNAKVRLALFWATNYKINTAKQVVDYAEKLLREHNIGLDVYPGTTRTDDHTMNVGDDPVLPMMYSTLRAIADAKYVAKKYTSPDADKRLVVIFCEFKDLGHGLTILKRKPGETTGSLWEPYCLVSGNTGNDDSVLIHEIGHAAHNSGQHSPDPGHIMHEAPVLKARTIIDKIWVKIIARAGFVV
jgi:hypothetical protein